MNMQRILDQTGEDVLDETPSETEQRETIEEIQSAFLSSGNDVTWYIRVGRVTGATRTGSDEPFCFTCSPEELPIDERLKKECGPGIYRARVYRNKRIYRSFTVTIDKSLAPPAEKPTDISGLMAAMEAANQRTMNMVQELLSRMSQPVLPPPAPDPFSLMEKMVTMMAGLRTLMPEQPQVNALELVTKGIELAQSFQGGNSGETNFMDIVKELVKSPMIENMMGAMAKQTQPAHDITPPAPTYIAPPAPTPTQGFPSMFPTFTASNDPAQVNLMVKTQIDFLIGKAQTGSDPIFYADFILDNLPEPVLQYMLNNPNILAEFGQINPAMNAHLPWFQKLLEAMRQLAQDDSGDAAPEPNNVSAKHPADPNNPNAGRQGGNASHPSPNGTIRQPV